MGKLKISDILKKFEHILPTFSFFSCQIKFSGIIEWLKTLSTDTLENQHKTSQEVKFDHLYSENESSHFPTSAIMIRFTRLIYWHLHFFSKIFWDLVTALKSLNSQIWPTSSYILVIKNVFSAQSRNKNFF